MHTVFLLASDLGTSATAKQLSLLAPALPRDQFRVEVGMIDPATVTSVEVSTRLRPTYGGVGGFGIPARRRFCSGNGDRSFRALREELSRSFAD